MEPIRIFIDTDIGDDVDDALAIALAALSPELTLTGVSTVYGNVSARRQLAVQLLRQLGTEVPVEAGVGRSLRFQNDTSVLPHQCRVLAEQPPAAANVHGVELLIETVRSAPETVVIALGPLTNIAMAVLLAPDIMKHAKIVLMGGAFSAVYPEYNILCDPEAANIVLRSGAEIRMIGLDVTAPCILSKEEEGVIGSFRDGYRGFLASLCAIWLETSKSKKVTLHDPLTVASLIDPTLLKMEAAPVRIEMAGGPLRGLTVDLRHPFRQREPLPPANVMIAVSVDAQRTCKLVMERVFGHRPL